MKYALLLLIISGLLPGCSVNPYTGDKQASHAFRQGIIGTLVCGGLGAVKGTKQAIIGAVTCGTLAAGHGYYMDVQAQKLRQQLVATGVQVIRTGNQIELVMPGNITFENNRSDIKGVFRKTLVSVAAVLREYDRTTVYIEGHTDSVGPTRLNQRLSEDRANSVARQLSQFGVAYRRLHATGKGATNPIASNDTTEGRLLNRRAVITIIAA